MASLADPRCKSPKEIIEKSLVANWDEDLVFMLGQSYNLYHFYQKQMKDCDKKIESIAKEHLTAINAKEPEKEWLRALTHLAASPLKNNKIRPQSINFRAILAA